MFFDPPAEPFAGTFSNNTPPEKITLESVKAAIDAMRTKPAPSMIAPNRRLSRHQTWEYDGVLHVSPEAFDALETCLRFDRWMDRAEEELHV
jgi:hypothetical protein